MDAQAYNCDGLRAKRLTDSAGGVTAGVELDPWGGDTSRSWQQHQQPRRFTSYQRDGNESDEAMFRRYNRWWSRFDQPDPSDGSYDLADPQSLNRYSYTQNDPVNFTDPTGLDPGLGGLYAVFGSHVADLPGFGTNWGSFFRERERAEYPQAHRRFDAILQNAQALP